MGYGKSKYATKELTNHVDETQILKFLIEAAENPTKFGVHQKHQKQLKEMAQLLLEHSE